MRKPLCIIVDDEVGSLAAIKGQIESLGILEVEKAYDNPDKFLVEIDALQSTIVFLDMEMPISGLEVAERLKNKLVIFVSGYTERGYKTFDVNAVDFVPKPIRASRLKSAIEKALEKLVDEKLAIRTQDSKLEEIDPTLIGLISSPKEGDPRDKSIHFLNGRVVLAKDITFGTISDLLPSYFVQVNSKTIVNSNCVTQLIQSDLLGVALNDKLIEVSLGDPYRHAFFQVKPLFN